MTAVTAHTAPQTCTHRGKATATEGGGRNNMVIEGVVGCSSRKRQWQQQRERRQQHSVGSRLHVHATKGGTTGNTITSTAFKLSALLTCRSQRASVCVCFIPHPLSHHPHHQIHAIEGDLFVAPTDSEDRTGVGGVLPLIQRHLATPNSIFIVHFGENARESTTAHASMHLGSHTYTVCCWLAGHVQLVSLKSRTQQQAVTHPY